MTPDQFTIAITGRQVSVRPHPLPDPPLVAAIHAALPCSEGWIHFPDSATRRCYTAREAHDLLTAATLRLLGVSPR